MRKLKKNIEERIKGLLKKSVLDIIKIKHCGDYIEIERLERLGYNSRWHTPHLILMFDNLNNKIKLAKCTNYSLNHKELMEIINIIHNNLCNEENWEEVE